VVSHSLSQSIVVERKPEFFLPASWWELSPFCNFCMGSTIISTNASVSQTLTLHSPLSSSSFLLRCQCPDKHHRYIAHVLGVPQHKVVIRTKRLGGGFGGKETRSGFINAACAIAAFHLHRPCRLVLDRDEDMQMTGQRHPFLARYRAAATPDGRLLAFDITMYNNAGNSLDLSHSIMQRALLTADCVYKIPSYKATGHLCKTNLPTNTAFRGFGGPQGLHITECIMDKLAAALDMPPERLKEINMYQEGDITPYGQALEGCRARACWEWAIQKGEFEARRKAVDDYNSGNRFRKRGLAVTPTKFGISFTTKFLNQAGALVHIYSQGECHKLDC
jgi:xanthine dehydrogenase/oxidase